MKILLVYPRAPDTFWSFQHLLRFVSKKAAFPPLGLLTVAAMLPEEWTLKLVDLNVEPLREDQLLWADYVLVSAMLVHRPSVEEIAARCAALGKPILAGGPLFTTGHVNFPNIPHFVLGEAEGIMERVVADMRAGRLEPCYRGTERPDISSTPVPRWNLIDLRHYITMAVQFSRGCPFDCDFCDIIVMNGRVPRTKSASQVVRELEALRQRGWKGMVFVVDDNFIGNKKRTKYLLREMIQWRAQTGSSMGFHTEASVNLADDPELCSLMAEAGFKKVFVGIETPSAESLAECGKTQNKNRDLVGAVHTLQRAGLEVMGGFIIGFDSDREDIFRRQFEFIQHSGVGTAMVGLLMALPQTRLYQRLLKEGRIESESSGNNTQAALNFRPRLSREFLQAGYRDLMKRLYDPGVYYQRVRTFLKNYQPRGPGQRLSWRDIQALLKSLWVLGVRQQGRGPYWGLFWGTLLHRPRQFPEAIELAIMGYHFRQVASRL